MKGQVTPRQLGVSIGIGFVLFLVMIVPLTTGKLKRLGSERP